MSILSMFKGSKKAAAAKNAQPAQENTEQKPMERHIHIPRHAARDAMAVAPPGWKNDDRQSVRSQSRSRLSRSHSEYSYVAPQRPSSMNPKLSRASSALSMEWNPHSIHAGPSHTVQAGPSTMASSHRSSFQSLPQIMQNGPPVPAIPAQYASNLPSPGPSSLDQSRNSSFHKQPNYQSADSFSRPRNSRSYFQDGVVPGKSPLQTLENSPEESEASYAASESSYEAIEMRQVRTDSRNMDLDTYDKMTSGPPRAYIDASPVSPIEENKAAKKYFLHPSSATSAAAPVVAPIPQKKSRFSFHRKSQAIAAN